MSEIKKIKNALISVFYKSNLEPIVRQLSELGIGIYSTGGTQKFIEELGLAVTPVESLTSYPSILGGRVKTLHPKVFGGILSRRETEKDTAQLEEYEIPEIDLVIVDLYPFNLKPNRPFIIYKRRLILISGFPFSILTFFHLNHIQTPFT